LHCPGHEIDLGDDAHLAFAIRHQLALARHCCDSPVERFALVSSVYAKIARNVVGAHRHTALAKMFEDALAAWNVDVAASGLAARGRFQDNGSSRTRPRIPRRSSSVGIGRSLALRRTLRGLFHARRAALFL
jgi:hypothetical protein